MDGTSPKLGITDAPHHITATSDLRTANSGRHPITPQTSRRREPYRYQDVYGMGHPEPLTTGIHYQIKGGGLGNGHLRNTHPAEGRLQVLK